MKSNNVVVGLLVWVAFFAVSCGSQSGAGGPGVSVDGTYISGINVMNLSVDGSLCGSNQYVDEPCTSITICSPSTGECQTISDILVDTGSYGLRVFSSAISVPLTPITQNGKTVTECATFGTGADWGPVAQANVIMGNPSMGGEETTSPISVQLIEPSFDGKASLCNGGSVDQNPQSAGYNGILGIGVFSQDCGEDCDPTLGNDSNNGMYFQCNGDSCSGTTLALAQQVSNPVAAMPTDNNGVTIVLPAVPDGGVTSVEGGSLILGVGTRSNNQPGTDTNVFTADPSSGEFVTSYAGGYSSQAGAILDSGTNQYAFDNKSMDQSESCSENPGFYCPSPEITLSALLEGYMGGDPTTASFNVGNLDSFSSANWVFSDIGGPVNQDGTLFIWGLPFFFGRTVYVGLDAGQSSLGQGTYFAY